MFGARFIFVLSTFFIQQSYGINFLQFSNQTEAYFEEARNYAILNGGSTSKLQDKGFSICGSIYVGYFIGWQSFYTMGQNGNDNDTLWFSL